MIEAIGFLDERRVTRIGVHLRHDARIQRGRARKRRRRVDQGIVAAVDE